jgi:hypothetical protein
MRTNRWIGMVLGVLAAGVWVHGQVVPPTEIPDAELRILQEQSMTTLVEAGDELRSNHFSYPFYLSRKLDIDEATQKQADQHSLRFERFNNGVVLAITGNYYAAYLNDKVSEGDRARESFLNVVLPILKIVVPHFEQLKSIQGYAIEISHHVRTKVIGMPMERPENMMVYLPQSAAARLVGAKTAGDLQAALMDAQVYVNAAPINLWLDHNSPRLIKALAPAPNRQPQDFVVDRAESQLMTAEKMTSGKQDAASEATKAGPSPVDSLASTAGVSGLDTSKEALGSLQSTNQALVTRMLRELDPQAHFVSYAPPAFIPFRRSVYLQFSVNTELPASSQGSRYKLAAMAFDEHISHLIRPAVEYWKTAPDFEGISFSTTVRVGGVQGGQTQAVEYYFPYRAMRCYEEYDCTGQQLIDAGTVLINGERVGLDLQRAEGDRP